MTPNLAQRLEGLAIFVATIVLFAHNGCSWWVYAIAVAAPDIAIAGYAFGTRIGATIYNTVHLFVWPVALGTFSFLQGRATLVGVALAWASHIGIDRALGFGLKFADDFKHTHLS